MENISVYRGNILIIYIFLLAILIRVALSLLTISYVPDEIWQYLEPAYGLLTGHWVITWEFREGIRSWLVPEVLAIPMSLGHALAPNSQWHLILPRAFLACLSLSIPYAFWWLGRRISTTHALVALFVGAFWAEIFYFSPRALGDSISCMVAFPAICAAYRLRDTPTSLRVFLAGFLVALCFVIRFQLAPALLLLSLWALWRAPRSAWPLFLAGAVLGLCVDALANAAVGAPPFVWILRNLTANLVEGRANSFGTASAQSYIVLIFLTWKGATIFIVPSMALGSRRFPVVLVMALAVFLTHSLIPHKELRFILFSEMSFIFLAAIGSVDIAHFLSVRLNEPLSRVTAAVLVVWLMMSASIGLTSPFKENWTQYRAILNAQVIAGRRPDICGFAVESPGYPAPSYAFLNRNVPILMMGNSGDAVNVSPRANTVVASREYGRKFLPNFVRNECMVQASLTKPVEYCVFTRRGNCVRDVGAFDYNRALAEKGL